MRSRYLAAIILLLICSGRSWANIKVITTTPDLAWVASKILGDQGQSEALLTGHEDAHYVDAVPQYILKVAQADLVCAIGLDLEVGWLPKVLEKSGKAQVQPGGKGYCEFGTAIPFREGSKIEVNRSMGDVHPSGNPHYYLDPLSLAKGSMALVDALKRLYPEKSELFLKNHALLTKELEALHQRLSQKLKKELGQPLPSVMQYHANFTYWLKSYGFHNAGSIEETPGVQPSAARVATIALQAKENRVKIAIAVDHQPKDVMQRFQEISGIPYLQLPEMVRPSSSEIADYIKLQNYLIEQVIKGLKGDAS